MNARAESDAATGFFRVVDDAGGAVEEANSFLRAVVTRGLSPQTVRAYAYDLVTLYRWMEASGRTLAGLVNSDLLDFVSHERGRGAHPASINRRLSTCRLLYRFWHPQGFDIAAGTSLPAPSYRSLGRDRRIGMHVVEKKRSLALRVKVPRKLIVPLTAEQVRGFLGRLGRYRDHAIVHLMLLCGLRSREVLALERRDVSLVEHRVRVSGKGGNERIVPLADLAAVSIEQYLRHERPQTRDNEALFVCLQGRRRGKAMTPAGLRSIFRSRRNSAPLNAANPHRFRHTFGADMARSGINLPVIQRLMGHENPEMTLRYINLSLSDIADAFRLASIEIEKMYTPGG